MQQFVYTNSSPKKWHGKDEKWTLFIFFVEEAMEYVRYRKIILLKHITDIMFIILCKTEKISIVFVFCYFPEMIEVNYIYRAKCLLTLLASWYAHAGEHPLSSQTHRVKEISINLSFYLFLLPTIYLGYTSSYSPIHLYTNIWPF